MEIFKEFSFEATHRHPTRYGGRSRRLETFDLLRKS